MSHGEDEFVLRNEEALGEAELSVLLAERVRYERSKHAQDENNIKKGSRQPDDSIQSSM